MKEVFDYKFWSIVHVVCIKKIFGFQRDHVICSKFNFNFMFFMIVKIQSALDMSKLP